MLPPGEWSWFLDRAHGVYDHLVVGTSLPWLLPPGLHHVESWNERLADSRRRWVARLAEQMRRAWDLEHWAAFRRSFDALGALFARIGSGARGTTGDRVGAGPAYAQPASISVLSGDVQTTRTWPGPSSMTQGCARRCTSSPARRSTTRRRPRCAR
jgi:hypothetical protein